MRFFPWFFATLFLILAIIAVAGAVILPLTSPHDAMAWVACAVLAALAALLVYASRLTIDD